MKPKTKSLYMNIAAVYAEHSNATVLKVGAILVKDDRIISDGVNGTPSGHDNVCEYKLFVTESEFDNVPSGRTIYGHGNQFYYLKTKNTVLHAESNCLAKLTKSTETGVGATLFSTHSPCMECAKLIYQCGIKHVIYRDPYRDDAGLEFLKQSGVFVEQYTEYDNGN